jgi:hypothetical protein
LFGVQKFFPILNCGDSSYYQFRDIEGPYFTLNTKNNQFQYSLLPSLSYTNRELDYPLVASMGDFKPNSDPEYFVAKSGDDIDKDIQNLKACFPSLKITRIASK